MAKISATFLFWMNVWTYFAASHGQMYCRDAFESGYNEYGEKPANETKSGNYVGAIIDTILPINGGQYGFFLGIIDGYFGLNKNPDISRTGIPKEVYQQGQFLEAFKNSYENGYRFGAKLSRGDIIGGLYDGNATGFCGTLGIIAAVADALFGGQKSFL